MPFSARRRMPRGLAVAALALGTAFAVQAQTALNARLAARPVTRGDIAAYKLPSTTQTSAGLFTVGVGAPLYLEAQVNSAIPGGDISGVKWELTVKPSRSKAALADSPLGPEVPVFEPSDRLVAQVAGRTLLRPDVPGMYVVAASVTTKSGNANLAQTFIAANYVGIATCNLCHSGGLAQNMSTSWAKTAHASIFKEGVNGVASDHYSGSCLACHTVGYDLNAAAVNGGFDDVATQLKWALPSVLKAGTWDTLPEALKNVGNIQCENCHGPGSVHASSVSSVAISVNMGSGVCGQCHDAPKNHIKSGEWVNSRHAVATREPSGAGREGCVVCHAGPGFLSRVDGSQPVNTAYGPINCQTCHEPHGQGTPTSNAHLVRTVSVKLADGTEVKDGGLGMLCMNCHQSRQNAAVYAATAAASSRFGPHHGPQADMLEGVNGFTYGKDIPSSAHAFVVEDTCVACHMQTVASTEAAFTRAGGHTFSPSWAGDDKNPKVELIGACQKCHGKVIDQFDFRLMDYDGDGNIDGVQTEVQHLLDKVSELLPPAGQAKSALTINATWTRAQLEAAYNWQFVKEDRSLGIHNTAYAVGLLKASLADLSKK